MVSAACVAMAGENGEQEVAYEGGPSAFWPTWTWKK